MQVFSLLPQVAVALGLLVGSAAADTFMVFSTKTTGQPRRQPQSYQFFDGPDVAWVAGDPTPDCFKAIHAMWWDARNDVSGDKHGVRIVGDDIDPDIFEWNTPDQGHYSTCLRAKVPLLLLVMACTYRSFENHKTNTIFFPM